jgi:hypothetical protein
MTEDHIDNACREYRKQQANEQLEKLSKTRTGILDREAAGAELDADGNWGIADRRESPPPRPMKRPQDWTEEEREEHMAAWREVCEEWESRMNDPHNYETGEWRRVNTSHNWERDR